MCMQSKRCLYMMLYVGCKNSCETSIMTSVDKSLHLGVGENIRHHESAKLLFGHCQSMLINILL